MHPIRHLALVGLPAATIQRLIKQKLLSLTMMRFTNSVRKISHPVLRGGQQHRFMSVINISDMDGTTRFQELNHKSVLYFTAVWCPPCKAIKPIYEKFAEEYKNVSFGKIDIDENSEAAMEFEVSAVPTFVFSHGEEVVERFSGADPAQLEALIKQLDEM
eukprot:scaffold11809_cov128-Cylindrotheca_fusiformis.AAC.10